MKPLYLIAKEGATYKRHREVNTPSQADENGRTILNSPRFSKSTMEYERKNIIGFIIGHYVNGTAAIVYDTSAQDLLPEIKKRLKHALEKNQERVAIVDDSKSESLEEKIKRIQAAINSINGSS